jgi:membrane protein
MKGKITGTYNFIKQVATGFNNDNVLKYSASLSYYTVFSLAPMLIIIISICGIVFGKEAMQGEIYGELNGLVGNAAALQIQEMIQNIHLSSKTPLANTISVIALLVGATGVFSEIQDSLNKIWGLKTKAKKIWWKLILNRLISFSLIISLGFILMVSLVLNAFIATLGKHINNVFSGAGPVTVMVFENVISLLITTLLFAVIFRALPDAKIKLKDVVIGGLVTAILFMLGKVGIGYYLGQSNLATVYGAAGSIVIIMIWVYYSSVILYLGAVFTKVYAMDFGGKILPNDYSVWNKVEEKPVENIKQANALINKVL